MSKRIQLVNGITHNGFLQKMLRQFILLLLVATPMLLKAQTSFVTDWNLATTGSGTSQLSFGVVTAGTVNYTWERISGTTTPISGSGTFNGTTCTITGLPIGATIRLSISPTNFQRININSGTDKNRLVNIQQWGSVTWTAMTAAFSGCINLENMTAIDVPDLSGVTSLASMFASCTKFNGNIGNWNTANATDMSSMFNNATSFNKHIGGWDVKKVTTVANMFSGATAFNKTLGAWKLNAITTLTNMFTSCGMDCATYSSTLIGWAANTSIPTGRNLGTLTGRTYGSNAASARNTLIISKSWTISGDAPSGSSCTLSNDATLSALTCSAGTINPLFAPAITSYDAGDVPLATTSLTITPTASNTGATVEVQINSGGYSSVASGNASAALNLNVGFNTIEVKVTAADGTIILYSITITRVNPTIDTRLSALTLSAGTLSPVFFSQTTSYVASLPNATTSLMVTATSSQTNSSIEIILNGGIYTSITSGIASSPLSMNAGRNTIDIKVTAPDGTTTKTYTIIVLRDDSFSFVTDWNLATTGSGINQLSFGVATPGAVSYTWHQLTGGTATGSGSFSGTTCTITGLPTGATIRLIINPTNFQRININNGSDKNRLIDIRQWGSTVWLSMETAFYGCSNMNSTALDAPSLTLVTAMNSMFQNCSKFTGDISNWNTSNVTNMSGMFSGATNFNQNIGNWNTSNVTNMSGMFGSATNFNQNIGNWNTSNVTNMSGTFSSARAFNQNIGNWNTSNVTNMNSVFSTATNFNQNIDNWNTSNVTNMSGMFYNATNFNQNIGNWNTANVTNMYLMFSNATNFNQNIGNWNISNVIQMSSVFLNATSFNQNIGNWNTVKVTDMYAMFSNATNFNQNISSWNTENVTEMSRMFSSATSFNQNLGKWTLNASVNLGQMLDNSGMDCGRYSATLIGWAANASTPNGRSLGSTGRTYGTNAAAARNTLITTKGWTISTNTASPGTCILATDATLSALTTAAGTVTPTFAPADIIYTASVLYPITSVTVTPTKTDANATIEVKVNSGFYSTVASGAASPALALNIGSNAINIKVTAEDGVTTKTYTLTVTRRGIVTWVGSTDNNWATATNWNTGTVPTVDDEVLIPAATANFPVLNAAQSVNNITVDTGKTINLGAALQVAGKLTNNGTVSGAAALIFNGTSAQIIEGTGSIENLEINNPTTVAITSGNNKLNITGTLTSTSGTFTTNSNLVLKSSSSSTARIAPVLGTITGNITQERYIPAKTARTYSLVASPFIQTIASSWQQQIHITGTGTGGTVCPTLTAHTNGFDATGSNAGNMYVYDGLKAVNTRWTSVTGTSNVNLTPGTGYRMNIRGSRSSGCSLLDGTASGLVPTAVTLSSTGSLSAANKNMGSFTITYNNNGNATIANDNYLLIGNPYPSEISFASLLAANNGTTGINNTYAIYAPGNTVNNYAFWNGTTFTGATTGLSNATGDIIANGQAFFIQSKVAGASVTMSFTESMKTASTNNGNFRIQANPNHLRIGYELANGNKADEIMLQFADRASNSQLNDGDVISMNAGSQNLKSLKAGRELAFHTRNINFTSDTVQLNVASTTNGSFKLSFYDFDEFVAGAKAKIYLLDKYTGTTQMMNDTKEYAFTVNITDAASFGKERFAVVFSKPSVLPSIALTVNVKAYPNPVINELKVQLPSNGSHTIKLMDAMGRVLVQQAAASNASINTSKLVAGIYMLEITNEKGDKSIEKIVKH